MDRYAVIGNPVSHSLSPEIHARFALGTGEKLEYTRLAAPEGGFADAARRFFREGGCGLNVTLPFKVDAFDFADARSPRSTQAGAANFLARCGDRIEADNTDGIGLVADLTRNLGLDLAGARILMLGAGGAARGVIAPLLSLGPSQLIVANRTAARAAELCARFRNDGPVNGVGFDAIPAQRYDLVINATSSSTRGEPIDWPAQAKGARVAYDMAYGDAARAFLARAAAAGARACDGLGMLVEQAAESFLLWRGKRPATAAVLAELRRRLA